MRRRRVGRGRLLARRIAAGGLLSAGTVLGLALLLAPAGDEWVAAAPSLTPLELCLSHFAERAGVVQLRAPADASAAGDFYYAWPEGRLQDRQGRAASGSCGGTREPLAVRELTLNAEELL